LTHSGSQPYLLETRVPANQQPPVPSLRRWSSASLLGLLALGACLSTVELPPEVGYHNPLDHPDGGHLPDGGLAPADGGANSSQGTIDGRTPNLTAAIYFAATLDGGQPRTLITLADVANLCALSGRDAGDMGPSSDVVRLRLAGDVPGTYLVAAALPPSGATAEFQYRSDAGAFGTRTAVSGVIALNAIDPRNAQPAQGLYTLTFSPTETLSGKFVGEPCAAISPPSGSPPSGGN
jgi:hypothetical protein